MLNDCEFQKMERVREDVNNGVSGPDIDREKGHMRSVHSFPEDGGCEAVSVEEGGASPGEGAMALKPWGRGSLLFSEFSLF